MGAAVRVGTSGWVYPHWRGRFYPAQLPARSWLAHYAGRFDTVEINSSFYRLPEPATLEAWSVTTPADFLFALKASRFLTHMKKLKDPQEPMERLLGRARSLGEKLGPVLFQLPPRFAVNVARLEALLALLPASVRAAFEFRDPSWSAPAVYKALERAGAAWCVWHLAGVESAAVLTAPFVYLRLHGPGGKYQGSYDDAALGRWADLAASWAVGGRDVFCYFDNDDSAFAATDAARLLAAVAGRLSPPGKRGDEAPRPA